MIALVAIVLLIVPDEPKATYHTDKGEVFGTYYAIQYESVSDLRDSIQATFAAFDGSMSMFNPQSTLSRINAGTDSVTDTYFLQMYRTAEEVNSLSGGAFDITVAPLVNLWGFGLKNREHVQPEQVESLLPHVGMQKLSLVPLAGSDRFVLRKADEAVQVDAGAIAKGQSCDIIAALLERNGAANYLVDIGGEIVAKGHNAEEQPWRIGITRPIDDATGTVSEVQTVLQTTGIALATSGNYRNFYVKDGRKYAHTIDPHTCMPVSHSLLSATVFAADCATADALATSMMVMGLDSAQALCDRHPEIRAYFIYTDSAGNTIVAQ